MAYTKINVQKPGEGGAELTESNGVAGGAGTGYRFSNDGRTFLRIRNTGAGTPNVVILTGATMGGFALGDNTIALTATAGAKDDCIAGPFPPEIYNQRDGSGETYIYFTGSDETDVRVAAFN